VIASNVNAADLTQVQCETRITGTLTATSATTLSLNVYGKIVVSGAMTYSTPGTLTMDMCSYNVYNGFSVTYLTAASFTGYLGGSNVTGLSSSFSGLCYDQNQGTTSASLDFKSNCTASSNPPPPARTTSSPLSSVLFSYSLSLASCSSITCNTPSLCPSPHALATCDTVSGQWVIDSTTVTVAELSQVACPTVIKGGLTATSSSVLRVRYCGTLILQSCFNFPTSGLTLVYDFNSSYFIHPHAP